MHYMITTLITFDIYSTNILVCLIIDISIIQKDNSKVDFNNV